MYKFNVGAAQLLHQTSNENANNETKKENKDQQQKYLI